MTDQTPPEQPVTGATTGQPVTGSETPNGKTPITELPPDVQLYIKELREEAEGHRKAKKAAEKAAQDAEQKRLAEQQEWQKLAELRAAELERLKPVADQYETITAAFNASLDNRLNQIPKDIRKEMVDPVREGMSPVDFSNWLDRNLARLTARTAPDLDGGAGSNVNPTTVKLTPIELEMAKAMNISPEVYAKRKAERDADAGKKQD